MDHLPQLNLPPIDAKFARRGSIITIYDPLRKKYVALTPEEWVRQHFTAWLIRERDYPVHYVVNELGLRVNGHLRRADTVVYDRELRPLAVIEYKNTDIPVTQTVFDQIVRYNMEFKAPFIIVSNGMTHYCCKIDFINSSYNFLTEIPTYQTMLQAVAK